MYIKDKDSIWVAKSDKPIFLSMNTVNRHGLIAGATGTGKTVTSKILAEDFSDMGIPVFMSDIKGDVSGLGLKGEVTDKIQERIDKLGVEDFTTASYPVRFFDVFGRKGIPVRASVSEMGPDLFGRLLDLNEVQSGVLNIVFRVADDKGMLLLDLKDLRAMVQHVGDNAAEYSRRYGSVSSQSIGAIQRGLLRMEDQGGDLFFGEPALDVMDWFEKDELGRGYINILHSVELFQSPFLYSTFMLWMLSEIYEVLPEVGDTDKPKMVFFFDEAHLLFTDAPKVLLQKIEQVVKLIRSKGVGIYFITQLPNDIPKEVLSQLGNKVQHALRAYTPNELKALKLASEAFRANPEFDTYEALTELGTGEALISLLDEKGIPEMVERAMVLPPKSLIGSMDDQTRVYIIQKEPLNQKYKETVDRESAYEILEQAYAKEVKAEEEPPVTTEEKAPSEAPMTRAEMEAEIEKRAREIAKEMTKEAAPQRAPAPKTYSSKSTTERTIDSAMTTIGREVSRQLVRGILGGLKK